MAKNIQSASCYAIDTPIIIYYIEKNPKYSGIIKQVFDIGSEPNKRIISSTITLIEVLIQPIRKKDTRLIAIYKEALLNSYNLTLLPIDNTIAEKASFLRAQYNIRTPDALQIATAMIANADLFLTNDKRLSIVKDIEIVILDDLIEERSK